MPEPENFLRLQILSHQGSHCQVRVPWMVLKFVLKGVHVPCIDDFSWEETKSTYI